MGIKNRLLVESAKLKLPTQTGQGRADLKAARDSLPPLPNRPLKQTHAQNISRCIKKHTDRGRGRRLMMSRRRRRSRRRRSENRHRKMEP